MPVTLVIARYNEDISWAREYEHVVVINKGAPNLQDSAHLTVLPAPNVGREAHSHLFYITNYYDKLPEHIVFLQGNPFEHYVDVRSMVRDVVIYGYTKNWTDASLWGDAAPTPTCTIPYWAGRELGHSHLTYGPWVQKFVGEYAGIKEVYGGGHFGVHRSRILRHPKSFYERLLEEVSYDNAPQEAHFLERAWIVIFGVHETENFERMWSL